MEKERKKNIRYIYSYIDDIEIEDRIFLANMIVQKTGKSDLFEEGTGLRILYKKINDSLLADLASFVKQALKKTQLNF